MVPAHSPSFGLEISLPSSLTSQDRRSLIEPSQCLRWGPQGCLGPLCSGQDWHDDRPGGLSVSCNTALSHLHPAAISAVTLTLPNPLLGDVPQWSPHRLADEVHTPFSLTGKHLCALSRFPAPSRLHLLKHPATRPNPAPTSHLCLSITVLAVPPTGMFLLLHAFIPEKPTHPPRSLQCQDAQATFMHSYGCSRKVPCPKDQLPEVWTGLCSF